MLEIVGGISLVLFACMMTFVGLYSFKKAKNIDGFLLGGRSIGPWMAAFSYGAAYFSAVVFIGYAGKHGWDIGMGAVWIGIGNAVLGTFLAWKLLAKRTKNMTHRLNSRTMPEFFESRYDSRFMKIYAAIIIFIFLVPYAASVYKGLGSLFSTVFPSLEKLSIGFSTTTICMFIVAVLTAIYLILGGYIASSVTDFIQGIIMISGVILMIISLLMHPNVGGPINAIKQLGNIDPKLTSVFGGMNWNFLMINILLTSFGTWGLPQMIHKYYTIKDDASIKRATVISTVFAFIIGGGAYYVGTFSRLLLKDLPAKGYDFIIPDMLVFAFNGNLWGNILLSVLLLCILSASMSTLSSVVLTSSSAISVDLLQTFKKDVDKKKQMLLTRVLCFFFIALSFVFANFNFSFIVSIMSYSWGVVAGAFIGPFLWGLYWKKTTKAGAISGLVCSILIVGGCVIFGLINPPAAVANESLYTIFKEVSKNSPTFGVASMAVSVAIVPLVSLFTPKYSQKQIDKVFEK